MDNHDASHLFHTNVLLFLLNIFTILFIFLPRNPPHTALFHIHYSYYFLSYLLVGSLESLEPNQNEQLLCQMPNGDRYQLQFPYSSADTEHQLVSIGVRNFQNPLFAQL